jgi:hypothetical protein
VRPADRRAIDKVLDHFIPDGVGRFSMTTAWRLAGPEMKAASTLRQWRREISPIPYYPVGGTTFDNWTTVDAGPNFVDFGLLISPRRGIHRGSWGLRGEMVRRGSHWLVNNLYVAATFNTAGVPTGPPDLTGRAPAPAPAPKAVLGPVWLIAIAATILFVVGLTPVLLFGLFLHGRLWRRSPQPLPPLPGGILGGWPEPLRADPHAGARQLSRAMCPGYVDSYNDRLSEDLPLGVL